ncbi:MAG: HAMP domain-containing sensor histidine kinase [Gammaproteobacteria bacterium]
MRSPLAAISSSAVALERRNADTETTRAAGIIRRSASRMAVLISDVMDLARARLGGGIAVSAMPEVQVGPIVEQVVAEARASALERQFDVDIALPNAINCDGGRLAQLVANLLANAVTHGRTDGPIRVGARIVAGMLEISVANEGTGIPEAVREKLFEPFYRASVAPRQEGLGLGLYIAAEIAKAHRGRITVDSRDGRTTFAFRMPVGDRGPSS